MEIEYFFSQKYEKWFCTTKFRQPFQRVFKGLILCRYLDNHVQQMQGEWIWQIFKTH